MWKKYSLKALVVAAVLTPGASFLPMQARRTSSPTSLNLFVGHCLDYRTKGNARSGLDRIVDQVQDSTKVFTTEVERERIRAEASIMETGSYRFPHSGMLVNWERFKNKGQLDITHRSLLTLHATDNEIVKSATLALPIAWDKTETKRVIARALSPNIADSIGTTIYESTDGTLTADEMRRIVSAVGEALKVERTSETIERAVSSQSIMIEWDKNTQQFPKMYLQTTLFTMKAEMVTEANLCRNERREYGWKLVLRRYEVNPGRMRTEYPSSGWGDFLDQNFISETEEPGARVPDPRPNFNGVPAKFTIEGVGEYEPTEACILATLDCQKEMEDGSCWEALFETVQ